MQAPTFAEIQRRLVKDVGSKLLWSFEDKIAEHSKVGRSAILDDRFFPFLRALERGTADIRSEIDVLLRHRAALPALHEISPDQRSISNDDRWKAYFLRGFGHRSESSSARCPRTATLVDAIPGVTTAFFSILSPKKHIPKHRGVYKGLLRLHLGVKVPPRIEDCRMEIDGATCHWREGEAFVFDDTYEHEVWNDSDEERVVLIVDFFRPLPVPFALVNRALVRAVAASPYVTDGVKNEREWEARFAAALAKDDPRPDSHAR